MKTVLVASDSTADADLVRNLLQREDFGAERSLDPARLAAAFEECRPKVLVLGYKLLESAERHYLGLLRQSQLAAGLPHRTLLLCMLDETRDAYRRCRDGVFDDYVQFWPFNHDALTLPMAVHRALHALEGRHLATATATIAVQARRIGELEALLQAQLEIGSRRAHKLAQAGDAARSEIGAVFRGLGDRLAADGLGGAVAVRDAARVRHALQEVDDGAVQPALGRMQQAIAPVEQWMAGLAAELVVPLAAARAIAEQARLLPKTVLVVDDDRFVARALQQIIADAAFDVQCASTAAEAMRLLGLRAPDLILLDVDLPDASGIDMLRQLKAHGTLSGVPVVMLTGRSEKEIIVQSMAAGARDFIVKPFDRDSLLKKVQRSMSA